MQSTDSVTQPELSAKKSIRLHYLDWLHVLAILAVFLFHAVHPFDYIDWHIKNAEKSLTVMLIQMFFTTWGMPFFFLMSGINSSFALRRRTASQFASERVKRLLIPFVVGSLVLSPIQLYYEWSHKVQTGLFQGSLLEFGQLRLVGFDTRIFGRVGYHLWFVGFLFAYSLIALPLLTWLKRGGGRRFTGWLAGVCEKRGGILLFIIPLAFARLVLQPFYPDQHHWSDFAYLFAFFILGHLLYSDERFAGAIRRDRFLVLAAAIISSVLLFAGSIAGSVMAWSETPGSAGFYLVWSVVAVNGWCWSVSMVYVGMRFLDFSNRWLQYARTASLPFFLLHQPVIIVIAFYVVQWDAGILVKLPVVVAGSFVATLGLYQLLRRISVVQVLLGMK